MNACLQNIVSINSLCPGVSDVPSTSGWDIWQAAEVKYKGTAAITDEKYVRGMNVLKAARDRAIMEVENDFGKILLGEGYSTNDTLSLFDAAIFNTNITNPATALSRGITIYSAKPSFIRKLKISTVSICPVQSVSNINLKVWDNNVEYTYPIQLVGGQVNQFNLDFVASGDKVRITLDNTNLDTYNAQIICREGCGGTLPNECGYVRGWNGTNEIKTEGFGISAAFGCTCDLSQLLCAWSKQYIGEIVFWKMRSLIMEEHLNSDRLNNFTIYNREDAEKKRQEFEATYIQKWNDFAMAAPQLMLKVNDPCITCNRPSFKPNV